MSIEASGDVENNDVEGDGLTVKDNAQNKTECGDDDAVITISSNRIVTYHVEVIIGIAMGDSDTAVRVVVEYEQSFACTVRRKIYGCATSCQ